MNTVWPSVRNVRTSSNSTSLQWPGSDWSSSHVLIYSGLQEPETTTPPIGEGACSQTLDHSPSAPCSPWAPATLSQWPHQRTTQRNWNDRLFIIAQPLCRRRKSIIKTRLTAKITAVSSIVLERAKFFFFLKGLLTSPASPWCNLLLISNPIAFWNWIYLTHSHSEWTLLPVEKKRDRFCVKLPEESGGFGFGRFLSLSAINLPTGRMSSLQRRTEGAPGGVAGC